MMVTDRSWSYRGMNRADLRRQARLKSQAALAFQRGWEVNAEESRSRALTPLRRRLHESQREAFAALLAARGAGACSATYNAAASGPAWDADGIGNTDAGVIGWCVVKG